MDQGRGHIGSEQGDVPEPWWWIVAQAAFRMGLLPHVESLTFMGYGITAYCRDLLTQRGWMENWDPPATDDEEEEAGWGPVLETLPAPAPSSYARWIKIVIRRPCEGPELLN